MVILSTVAILIESIVVLVQPEKLLLEYIKLVFNVLDISTECCLHVHICPPTDLSQTLLNCFSDFLGELECCHTVFNLYICGIQIDTEDNFCVL